MKACSARCRATRPIARRRGASSRSSRTAALRASASSGDTSTAAPEAGEANDYIDPDDIYAPLWIEALPGDAMPTDYVIDEQGVVRSIERMYRGPWTLVVPSP